MSTIYTVGYMGLSVERLKAEAQMLGAVVVDVRYRPYSRNAAWNRPRLEGSLGGERRYFWAGETLGNVNYKGGPVKLANPGPGVQLVTGILDHKPVILLCVCKSHKGCHRTDVARLVEELDRSTQRHRRRR